MVKFILNKKSLMTFGKWSLALFSLVLIGFFVVQYIPILALDPPNPKTDYVNVTLISPANNGYTSGVNFTFNVSWSTSSPDFNPTNCTLFGNFTGTFAANATNATTLVNNVVNGINASNVTDGLYIWNVYCYNATNAGNYSNSNFTVTVDLTNPILNTSTPADESYIKGSDGQAFQVYVYDTNLNVSNVTFWYRKSGASPSDWTTNTSDPTDIKTTPGNMNCYASGSGVYICNVTVDNLYDKWGENVIIDYYFEAFDNATRYNSNGTRASPWNVTIDRTAPWFSSNSPLYGNGQKYNPSTNFGFQINVVDKISGSVTGGAGVAKVLFESNFSGTLTNTTASGTNPYYVNFTGGQFANATVNYTYKWYTNDSVTPNTDENWNTTDWYQFYMDKADNSVTLYINGTATTSNVTLNYANTINATVTDAGNTYNIKLYRDNSDVTSENGSAVRLAANTDGYEYRANTTGNENYTSNNTYVPNFYVIVNKAAVSLTMYLSGTQDNNITIANGASVNMTVVSSGNDLVNTEGTLFLYVNDNEYNQTSDATSIINISTITGTALQEFNITGYFNGSQNYSAPTPIEYYIKIESTTPTYADLAIMWHDATNFGTIGNLTNNSVIGNQSSHFNISTNWTDNEQLHYYWLMNSTDGSSFSNTTALAFIAANNFSNITINPGQYVGGTVIQFKICANDTTNNQNCTSAYRYTIDGTAPSLNTTTPTPNAYVRRSSSQLFQIYVYDQTMNVSNATLYYKGSIAGGWTTSEGNMNCYGNPPSQEYICNKTESLLGYGSGDVIYYYFEAFDNSSIMGSNGSTSSYNQITLDDSAPKYSNNDDNVSTISKYNGALIYSQWTESVGQLAYAILSTNETGGWVNYTGNTYNSPAYLVGNTSAWSNFTWGPNTSLTSGTGVSWKIYVNDSAGNENVTADGTFTVDGTKPTYDNNNVTNITRGATITKSTPILISFNWTDDVGLDLAWLSTNETGGWVNYSSSGRIIDINLSGTQTWSNFTWQNTSVSSGMEIAIKIYANDTSGNENVTDTMVWTVDSTKPTYFNNGTSVAGGSTIVNGTSILIYANWTDQELHGWWVEHNTTGGGSLTNTTYNTTFGTGNWTNYTITAYSSAGGLIQARIFVNDSSNNMNYTIPTWNWTVDGTIPTYANESISTHPSRETVYAPGVTYIFNISWTDNLGDGNVSKVLFNFSSAATNYTSATSPDVKGLGSSNYSITLTDLGVGNYTYRWFANDTSNNWNSTTVYTLNITQNTTNPIIMYLTNTTTYNNTNISISAGNTVTVNGTFIYPNAGTITIYSNVTTNSTNLTNVANTSYTTLSSLLAGTYAFIANTTGNVNYTSNSTGPGTFYLTVTSDVTAPTVLLYDYNNATAKKSGAALILNISVSDATGIASDDPCNVTINGTVNSSITYSGGWCNGTITVPSGTEGTHVINITVKDNSTSKNVGINSTFYIIIDNTAPIITISTPSNNTYNKLSGGYIWINGSVTDALQMGTGNVTISGTNASQFIVYNFTGVSGNSFAVYNNTTVSDGLVVLTLTYIDNATNSGSNGTQFYVDNTPPSSINGDTTGTKAKNSSQVIQVTVVDDMTNASITLHYCRMWYDTCSRKDDTNWQTTTMTGTPAANTVYNATIDTSKCENNEKVYYYVTGTDNATNPFSSNNGTAADPLGNITIGEDTTAPSLGSTDWPSSTETSEPFWVIVDETNNETGLTCEYYIVSNTTGNFADSGDLAELDEATYDVCYGTTVSGLVDDDYTLTFTCEDSSGNSATHDVAFTVSIDTTAPTVAAADTSPGKDSNGKISDSTPTLSVNTSESGVCKYDTTDKDFGSLSNEMTGTGTTHTATLSALSDGTYTYYIRCNDTAGNNMTVSATISFILDTTGNFNYTQDLTSSWNTLWLPSQSVMEVMNYTSATTNGWNISYVLSTTGGLGTNYNLVYYYNGSAWASFSRGSWAASSLQYVNNTNDKPYWINMTATDRFEI